MAWDEGRFDSALFDVRHLCQTLADILAVADASTARPRPRQADTASLLDSLLARAALLKVETAALADNLAQTARMALADTTALTDAATRQALVAVADAATLTDALAHLMQAIWGDPLSVADALSATPRVAAEDFAAQVDALSLRIMPTVGSVASLADTLAQAIAAYRTDTLTIADALAAKAEVPRAEALAVTEAIAGAIARGAEAEALSIAEAVALRIALPATDPVALGDEATATPRPSAQELLTLSEAILGAIGKPVSNLLDVTDALAQMVGQLTTDTATTADDLATKTARALTDLADLADSIWANIAARRPTPASFGTGGFDDTVWDGAEGEPLALGDDLEIKQGFGALLEDLLALADELRGAVGAPKADAADLLDTLAAHTRASRDDTTTVADALGMRAQVPAEELLDVADALLRKALVVFAESLGAADVISAAVAARLGDATGLADAVANLVQTPAADTTGVADAVTRLWEIIRAVDTGLTIEDLIGVGTKKPPDDTTPINDQLIAALYMVRQASDLFDAADAAWMLVRMLRDEQLALTDDMTKGIKAAQAEALTIAEALGADMTKPLPADAVGIIDEALLQARIQAGVDTTTTTDNLAGWRRFAVLNQVFIEGVSVPVVGLAIRQAATERVGYCRFSIPNPTPQVLALCRQRASVRAYLTEGQGADYFSGHIVGNPATSATTLTTKIDIDAHDDTAVSHDILVTEIFTDAQTLTDAVVALWSKYAPFDIDLSQVVASDKRASFLAFKYDTLFAATEYICGLLGWVWFVDWDGAQRTLRFYPPALAVKPITLSRPNLNVVAGTARFGQDDQIYNRVYVFGGTALSVNYTRRILADGESALYSLNHKPYPPEGEAVAQVSVGGIPQVTSLDYPYWPDGKDCLVNHQGRFVRWREDNKPAKDAVIAVTYRYEYPVSIMLEDHDSIARYGLIEHRIVDSKIRDSRQARDLAKQLLRNHAYPRGYGALETTVTGLRAGDFVTVDMPHLGAQGLFEVNEIEKRVEGVNVRRAIVLNRADDAGTRIAERLRDFAKRLADLELKDLEENPVIQYIKRTPETVEMQSTAKVDGRIEPTIGDTPALFEGFQARGPRDVRQVDPLILDDGARSHTRPRKDDVANLSETLGFNDGFFDKGKFDDALAIYGCPA